MRPGGVNHDAKRPVPDREPPRVRRTRELSPESVTIYQMELPYTVDEIIQGCLDMVTASGLESCYIRPIAFYGYDTLGVHPRDCPVHVAIACFDWGAYLGDDGITLHLGIDGIGKRDAGGMRTVVGHSPPLGRESNLLRHQVPPGLPGTPF